MRRRGPLLYLAWHDPESCPTRPLRELPDPSTSSSAMYSMLVMLQAIYTSGIPEGVSHEYCSEDRPTIPDGPMDDSYS